MVIILVLALLVTTQMCNSETYFQIEVMHSSALASLVSLYNLGDGYWSSYKIAYEQLIETTEQYYNRDYPLVYLQTADAFNPVYWGQLLNQTWDQYDELRMEEIKFKSILSDDGVEFVIGYSILQSLKLESLMNILRTCFLCVVLAVASLYFTKDA